jgi:hypothetical protein
MQEVALAIVRAKKAMLKKSSALKEWTEILTSWLQVLGLFAAGIFALVEYQEHKKEEKIQRAVDYISQADSESLIAARLKLSQNEQSKAERFREVLDNASSSQDETNIAYFQFVVDELVKYSEEPGLKTEFYLLLGYLDEGVVCSQQGLCDEHTIRASFGDFGKGFVQTYTPYLCFLRRTWNDPSIGSRVERFYNRAAAATACSDYYKSISKVQGKGG